MLKTSGSIKSLTRLGESVVEVGSDNRAERNRNKLDRSELDDGEVDKGQIDNEIGKEDQKTSKFNNLFKSKKSSKSKKTLGSDFFTPGARLAFTKLR